MSTNGLPPVSPLLTSTLPANNFRSCTRRQVNPGKEVESRQKVLHAHRIVIKAGTSVVSDERGYPSLTRLGAIVEQCAWLRKMGKEVLLVSSGAVGVGRQLLRKQQLLNSSLGQVLDGHDGNGAALLQAKSNSYNSACAAAGQLGLMSLYDTLFSQCDTATSQMLLTADDFGTPERCRNLRYTMNTMLQLGVIPIVNENDAVSANQGYTKDGTFSDNDGLAAVVAQQMGAQLLVLLTDVDGVYDKAPTLPGARIIHTYLPATEVQIGDKSVGGRGGMSAKISAAMRAVEAGVASVVIANGCNPFSIEQVCCGEKVGTLFCQNAAAMAARDLPEEDEALTEKVRVAAEAARAGGRALCQLSTEERTQALHAVAKALGARQAEVLAANARDMQEAERVKLAGPLLKRLQLTPAKIQTLVDGINSLADQPEPIGKCMSHLEVSEGLVLKQVTTPIGVLLVVFESRPDSLPQIASLALRSGNGLLLKGGKEAEHSNACLHGIIADAVFESTGGRVCREVIGLVVGRQAVAELLKLDALIDLVIPRGSGELVNRIKSTTKIPVLGHAEGVCHMFIDTAADEAKAIALAVDAKINYPAACNALETLLVHQDCVATGLAKKVADALVSAGGKVLGGPRAIAAGLATEPTPSFKTEYGENSLSLEVVDDAGAAIDHIHRFGSGHTEAIVTEDAATAQSFLERVDSACVFHNASTRFSDGFRFGLGAEVGISTGRIHARGPVGVEGLLTTKWVLRSSDAHTVAGMGGESGRAYTHKALDPVDGI
ncbi:Aldehyde/histidinol dehydrogenase [Tribonema minus]|uniref:Delta-1-pyrroline-5-carboxylate synthase n=1 Tax=Tribonema minus TaxID=303371 RepID=A0A835ZBW4_9STRA|nr:Aldehyde/histidinol dehydrogenase [Tribonema minus]